MAILIYLIGYIGFVPQYCEIHTPNTEKIKIHPKHSSPKPQQDIMLTNRRRFYKIHKTKKISKNYEGTGKNYPR